MRRWNLAQKSVSALFLGVALGLSATLFLLETGFGFNQLKAGPWVAWPRAGATELDPYLLAKLSFFHEIPLGPAEGLKFIASVSSSGAPLSGRCDYIVRGELPQARFWTLDLYARDGKPLAGEGHRPGLSSAELLRLSGGGFEIIISPNARPGNWLHLPNDGWFCLALTLYDTEGIVGLGHPPSEEMPSIIPARCR